MAKISNSKDLLMLLLYAPTGSEKVCIAVPGQTRLMKMVFLFKKEIAGRLDKIVDTSALPSFEAYDFGPFSAEVYSDLEFLVNNGLVEVQEDLDTTAVEEEQKEIAYWSVTNDERVGADANIVARTFSLSPLGKQFVEEVLLPDLNISSAQMKIVAEFKKRCIDASLRSLLRYVYTRYENMTTKSKIKNDILR